MNTGARVGLAVAAGYLLGRTHKMKWALGLAALAGRGRLPGIKGGLLQHGAEFITSSPELAKLTDQMRGRLVDAGKAAAVAAISGKIDSLSDGLHDRSDLMRAASSGGSGDAAAEDEEAAEDEQYRSDDERLRDEDRAADSGRRRHPTEDDDSPVPAQRRAAPRAESDRSDASGQSRSREGTVAHGRARNPSRHSGGGERSGGSARQGQDSGRGRPRSSASRKGGGSG
jgi:hypothetical protein